MGVYLKANLRVLAVPGQSFIIGLGLEQVIYVPAVFGSSDVTEDDIHYVRDDY
jgi:hypothetical protein